MYSLNRINPLNQINPNLNLINIIGQNIAPNIRSHITPDIYLSTSIILETISTICLKNTIQNNIWYIPSYCGYAISFYIFPKSLSKYTLSTAYTLWCGFGIILTTLIDKLFYKEIITFKKLSGIFIILYGIGLSK